METKKFIKDYNVNFSATISDETKDNMAHSTTQLARNSVKISESTNISNILSTVTSRSEIINLNPNYENTNIAEFNKKLLKEIEKYNIKEKNYNQEIERLNSIIKSQNSSLLTQGLLQDMRKIENENKILLKKQIENEYRMNEYCSQIKEYENEITSFKELALKENSDQNLRKLNLEKIDSQAKIISQLKTELQNSNIFIENLNEQIREMSEKNSKLNSNYSERKYNFNERVDKLLQEDLATQTVLSSDSLDKLEKKLEQNSIQLAELNTEKDSFLKQINNLKEKCNLKDKENRKLCDELNIMLHKQAKNKTDLLSKLDKETLSNIMNYSKLNTVISNMKIRENELVQKLSFYEKDKEIESTFLEKDLSESKFIFDGKNLHKYQINESFSKLNSDKFNTSTVESNNILMQNIGKLEIELNKLYEDNCILKESNFNLIKNIKFLNLKINEITQNYSDLNQEKNIIKSLSEQIAQKDTDILSLNDTLKSKENDFIAQVNKLNDQLNSLKSKFQVQNSLFQEKSNELKESENIVNKLKEENEKLLDFYQKNKEKLVILEKEKENFKTNFNNLKNEMKIKIENSDFQISELSSKLKEKENETNLSRIESDKLRELNSKLKTKLKDMYDDLQLKEEKIREFSYINDSFKEIQTLNCKLTEEKLDLRYKVNDLITENNLLREKIITRNTLARSNSNSSFDKISLNTSFVNADNNNKVNKKTIKKMSDEITKITNENNDLKLEIENMKGKLLEFESTNRNFLHDIGLLEIEKKKLKDLHFSNENEIKELRFLLEKKSEQQYLKQIEDLVREINEKNQTINYLITECDSLKNEKIGLKSEIEKLIEELNYFKDKFEKTAQNLEKLSQEKSTIINDLNGEIKVLLNDLEQKEKENNELTLEIDKVRKQFDQGNKDASGVIKELDNALHLTIQENDRIKNELKDIIQRFIEDSEKITGKIKNTKLKIVNIGLIHERHIEIFKEKMTKKNQEIITNCLDQGKNKDSIMIDKLMKLYDQSSTSTNTISAKESKIEFLNSEIKTLKVKDSLNFTKIKELQKENQEIKDLLNRYKKINKNSKIEQQDSINSNNISLNDLLSKLKEFIEKCNQNADILNEVNEYKIAINILEAKNLKSNEEALIAKDEKLKLESKLLEKDSKIKSMNQQFIEEKNNFKAEIIKLNDEITRVKEKSIPIEKYTDLQDTIKTMEKSMKQLKDDNNRKKELLKFQKEKDTKPNLQENSNKEKESENLNEKLKSTLKELGRKDAYLNEMKNIVETLKNNEKKTEIDLNQLNEKVKLLKNDIQRKDEIIKTLKDNKDTQNDLNPTTNIDVLKDKIKKLNQDLSLKDSNVKSLKSKIEFLQNEIERLKSQNIEIQKVSVNEKEMQKNIDKIKKEYNNYVANYQLILKRIFKDIINHIESKLKLDSKKINLLQEGMDILQLNSEDISEFMGSENSNNEKTYENICKLIENQTNIDPSLIFTNFLDLKERLINYIK